MGGSYDTKRDIQRNETLTNVRQIMKERVYAYQI
jgi:hypothetical protein